MKVLSAVAAAVLLLAGCSKNPGDLKSEGPTNYGGKIKTLVNELIKTVGSSPKKAEEQGSVLLEELEVYEKQPVGEHKETYAALLTKCQELVAAGKEGSASKVPAILREMKTLADKLPGEVAPAGPDEE